METPEAAGARVPPEVSLEPLVTVVAILGELGATAGDVPLAGPVASLRAGLVAFVAKARRAMGHRAGEATSLRHALATVEATTATSGATPEPTALPPGGSVVPGATVRDTWATVATIARRWREAVAALEVTWATLARDIAGLRDACDTAATAGATGGVTMGHLAAAVATEDKARRELVATARALPVASELATVAEAVTSHRTRVAEASAGLKAATEATEVTAVAAVGAAVATERSRRAAVAREPLGRLVAACDGATRFYRHLCCHLKDVEATVAALAAGCGGPKATVTMEDGPGVPKATMTMQVGPGVPKATTTMEDGPGVPKATVTMEDGPGVPKATVTMEDGPGVPKATTTVEDGPGVPKATMTTQVGPGVPKATTTMEDGPGVPKATVTMEDGPGVPKATMTMQVGPGVPKATTTMEDGPGVPKATMTTQVGPGVPKATTTMEDGPGVPKATVTMEDGPGVPKATMTMQVGPGVPKATTTVEDGPGVPKATVTTPVGPGVPKDLMAAVTVAEALWDASARLAKCHLLEALKVTRELLTTPGVPSVTAVTSVATSCRAATAALAGLLPRGPR